MSLLSPRRTILTSAAAAAALLIVPSVGSAATTFGSLRTTNDPTKADCAGFFAPCTIVSYVNPSNPNGDPYSGGAPVSGVITKFRIRAYGNGGPATATFRVGNVTPAGDFLSAAGTAGPAGPTVTVPTGPVSPTPITEVAANVPVAAGQHIAVDGSEELVSTYDSSGSKFSYVFAPPLVAGQAAQTSKAVTGELLASATIEPYSLTGLKVSGRKVSYSLNAASTVKIALGKASKGRKVNKKCVRQTRKNRNKKRCTFYKKVKSINGAGKVGSNSVKLPKLRSGKYQLTLTATDSAGNKTVKVKTFTVKKRK